MDVMKSTADLILSRLAERGLSQADLARLTHIQRQNLSAMLLGKQPMRVHHLLLILFALDLDLDLNDARWP